MLTSDPCPFLPIPHPFVFFPITGAGSGIGRAVSVRLAQEGAAVAACDLDRAAARETVQLLGGPGSEKRAHTAFQTDVSEAGSARHLLEQVQVNASNLIPFKALHCLHCPWLFVVFWCITSLFHRPALLARHLSLCPVRALPGMSFYFTCLRMTGTKS